MFKSVFSKYFTISACLLLVAMIALGAVQLVFFNQYWIDNKRTQLTENAAQIAQHTCDVTTSPTEGSNTYIIEGYRIKPTVDLVSEALDADVLIVDTAGRLLITSEDVSVEKNTVPHETIEQIGSGHFEVSTMNGLFSTPYYTAATPILMNDRVPIGYVITAMPADDLFFYLQETLNTYLMSALLVLLVFSIVIYLATYRMVKPLREMAAVTRRFAEGDFSCRVTVRGRDEVAELATALNSMAVSLSSTENMSRSFVANVSHELKTPMTTISGFIDGILDGTIPKEKQDHYLRIVSDEVRRLSRLVKSMLELSRIDNGSVALNPVSFDLTEAVCGTLLSFEQRIDEKHVTVEGLSECSRVMVTADYDLLGQVVYNLLDNAVKFVNENGVIAVRVTHTDGKVFVAIRNSGAGLASEEMPRVFERFYKTDRSRSLDKTGVGLGLYIVKTVINLHQGEIRVRSMEGEYTEFSFWLPADEAKPEGEKTDKHGNKHT